MRSMVAQVRRGFHAAVAATHAAVAATQAAVATTRKPGAEHCPQLWISPVHSLI